MSVSSTTFKGSFQPLSDETYFYQLIMLQFQNKQKIQYR